MESLVILREQKQRLENEQKISGLPYHRKVEIDALLYDINEKIKYAERLKVAKSIKYSTPQLKFFYTLL